MPAPARDRLILATMLLIAAAVFTTGITWGLPSRRADRFLFGSRTPWTGQQVLALTQSADEQWEDPSRGADVASGVLAGQSPAQRDGGVCVNATDAQRAQIVRRYRLFTYQPDEMITLMSLAKMHPGSGDLDPRLYQYGGLWIYPVGALLKAASVVHLVQLRSGPTGLAFYLDHPEAFGRFYVVARLYSAAWGLVGVWAVSRIVRLLTGYTLPEELPAGGRFERLPPSPGTPGEGRGEGVFFAVGKKDPHPNPLPEYRERGPETRDQVVESDKRTTTGAGDQAHLPTPAGGAVPAALAALLFCLMPVVVNMAHEAKPHLPGAVIQLLAVLAAVRYVRTGRLRDALLAGAACGAALGMVLSTVPIFCVLPLMTLLRPNSWRETLRLTAAATLGGLAVYAATNPYVVIHAFWHREVLKSNIGNSTAMYKVGRPVAGLLNEARLVADGMSVPLALVGAIGAIALGLRAVSVRNDRCERETNRRAAGLLLAAPALLVAGQCALIGAGKPGEFGRFLLLPDIFLMIEAVVALATYLPELTEHPLFSARGLAWSQNLRGVIRTIAATVLLASTGLGAFLYLKGFYADSQPETTRLDEAGQLQLRYQAGARSLALAADPAPYCLPPVDLFQWTIMKVPGLSDRAASGANIPADLVVLPVDQSPGQPSLMSTPISWANKLFRVVKE
jgi:hypothetical protein